MSQSDMNSEDYYRNYIKSKKFNQNKSKVSTYLTIGLLVAAISGGTYYLGMHKTEFLNSANNTVPQPLTQIPSTQNQTLAKPEIDVMQKPVEAKSVRTPNEPKIEKLVVSSDTRVLQNTTDNKKENPVGKEILNKPVKIRKVAAPIIKNLKKESLAIKKQPLVNIQEKKIPDKEKLTQKNSAKVQNMAPKDTVDNKTSTSKKIVSEAIPDTSSKKVWAAKNTQADALNNILQKIVPAEEELHSEQTKNVKKTNIKPKNGLIPSVPSSIQKIPNNTKEINKLSSLLANVPVDAIQKVTKVKSENSTNVPVDTFNKIVLKQGTKTRDTLKATMKTVVDSAKKDKNEYTSSLNQEVKERIKEMQYFIVKAGDTLYGISKEIYGNPMEYPIIFKANPDILNDPNRIYIRQKLRVPAKAMN